MFGLVGSHGLHTVANGNTPQPTGLGFGAPVPSFPPGMAILHFRGWVGWCRSGKGGDMTPLHTPGRRRAQETVTPEGLSVSQQPSSRGASFSPRCTPGHGPLSTACTCERDSAAIVDTWTGIPLTVPFPTPVPGRPRHKAQPGALSSEPPLLRPWGANPAPTFPQSPPSWNPVGTLGQPAGLPSTGRQKRWRVPPPWALVQL